MPRVDWLDLMVSSRLVLFYSFLQVHHFAPVVTHSHRSETTNRFLECILRRLIDAFVRFVFFLSKQCTVYVKLAEITRRSATAEIARVGSHYAVHGHSR